MTNSKADTEELVRRVAPGDSSALSALLEWHRDRLERMVVCQMDRRLLSRLEPGDVLQVTMVVATRRLSECLRRWPVAFYPWLRRLAWEQILKLQEKHVQARHRSVSLERSLAEHSTNALADLLAAQSGSPCQALQRQEVRRRVRHALDELALDDREELVLRFLEQLTTAETAAVFDVSPGAVKMRHRRALLHISALLANPSENP